LLYHKNREALVQKFPHIGPELEQTEGRIGAVEIKLEMVKSKTGHPVARIWRDGRQIFLNSPYDPELETDLWLDTIKPNQDECLIIFGAGFLYHLRALNRVRNSLRIVVYEPSPEILLACLREVDWEPLLSGSNFLLITGIDYQFNVMQIFQYMGYDFFGAFVPNFRIEIFPSYFAFFKHEVKEFQAKIIEMLQIIRLNLITNDYFLEKWVINGLKNLQSMINSPVVSRFFNQFTGVPAIIVSGGPSLEKNIHLLNAVQEKALIFCAGTSIRAMLHHGVRPHFLAAIDGDEINRVVYNDLDLSQVYLIYSSRFSHEVVTSYGGPKILMKIDTETFPDLLTARQGNEIGTVRSGFSISHTCLDLAISFGCNPVILVGQDLAFSSNKRYAEGQVPWFQEVIDSESLMDKDIYGQDIVTSKFFKIFGQFFERMISGYGKTVTIINATEGGISIDGALNRNLGEVLAEYCKSNENIQERIRLLYEHNLQEIKKRPPTFEPLVASLKNSVNQAIIHLGILIDRIQELRYLMVTMELDPEQLPSALDRITAVYDKLFQSPEFNILLKELRESRLSVIQLKVSEIEQTGDWISCELILRHCLLFFNETMKYLKHIWAGIQEIQPQDSPEDDPFDLARNLDPDVWGLYEPHIRENGALTNFSLYKISQSNKDWVKANRYLEKCRKLNYRTGYCWRRLIKNHFLTRNYITVIDLISEYPDNLPFQRFFLFLQQLCLNHLGIDNPENHPNIPFRRFFKNGVVNEYQETYLANREFFKKLGVDFGDYGPIRYKALYFLNTRYIYDSHSGRILPDMRDPDNDSLELTPDDVLIIHDPEHPAVFERLQSILNQAEAGGNLPIIQQIPVFIVEHNLEHWHRWMQLFNFNHLHGWPNLHFCIAPTSRFLFDLFLKEDTPCPTMFSGMGVEDFCRFLTHVIAKKDELYQKRLQELFEYYQYSTITDICKVLIISSRFHQGLSDLGKTLQADFCNAGLRCILYTESPLYGKFTTDADLKILYDFRPDLVLHLFAARDELEIFKVLPIPFKSLMGK
jgi:hypothetical protein